MKEDLKLQLEYCLELTTQLVNAHHNIPDIQRHPSDIPEMVRDIHNIQNRIFSIAQQNGLILNRKTV